MSAATYLITLTFFLSTSGVAEATAGGFPAISAAPGQFLLKDLVLRIAVSPLCICTGPPWLMIGWGASLMLFSADVRTCGGSSA
jgi:reactive chlorine resistance protein C